MGTEALLQTLHTTCAEEHEWDHNKENERTYVKAERNRYGAKGLIIICVYQSLSPLDPYRYYKP